MMRLLSFILIFQFLAFHESRAEIRETKKMSDVFESLDGTTLLVFDLDNTLIEPVNQLGSDQWYYMIERKYREFDGLSEEQAYQKAMFVWNQTQSLIEIKAVEKNTPELIAQAQAKKIKMLGLTARTLDIADQSVKQLNSIGIDFTSTAVHTGDLLLHATDQAKYTRGVLFVGDRNNKGLLLAQLLKEIQLRPSRIVFVDDKLKHVKNVENALSQEGIPYLGFRYGATDEKVKCFNADTANLKLFFQGDLH